ncbi:DNA cytosine methyltransferase [Staphylococcus aureus]|nr:DNA cytosine methyltransferase [Staphylococcus aureus]WRN31794.1 DNA cytosine methyltransferase [Staphylococcus aureus]WRN34737.1 DNA cytosine methyltransferase [Staphylococcus aureus]WRN35950.1 DNA cytosine methyltransferase [Staphylococcus aureus]
MIKVLELFSGVGSFSISLNTLGIEHEIVGFSETRKTATQLFCKLHNKKKVKILEMLETSQQKI